MNEPPAMKSVSRINITEGIPANQPFHTAVAVDPDGDICTYAIMSGYTVGEGSEWFNPSPYPFYKGVFQINETSGAVSPTFTLDYETGPTFVRASHVLSYARVASDVILCAAPSVAVHAGDYRFRPRRSHTRRLGLLPHRSNQRRQRTRGASDYCVLRFARLAVTSVFFRVHQIYPFYEASAKCPKYGAPNFVVYELPEPISANLYPVNLTYTVLSTGGNHDGTFKAVQTVRKRWRCAWREYVCVFRMLRCVGLPCAGQRVGCGCGCGASWLGLQLHAVQPDCSVCELDQRHRGVRVLQADCEHHGDEGSAARGRPTVLPGRLLPGGGIALHEQPRHTVFPAAFDSKPNRHRRKHWNRQPQRHRRAYECVAVELVPFLTCSPCRFLPCSLMGFT